MNKTQDHLSISDIKDGLVLLKGGGGALVIRVSAVNFGLLSESEQLAIITAFAQMLNSLSFSIQIVIYSQRLNINSYLHLLDEAQKMQPNSLLSSMMSQYRQFIQTLIKENEVLDKKFYAVIPVYAIELGLSPTDLFAKIKTLALPRRDQVLRQLSRIGLSATPLTTKELIELFYDIYNGTGENWVPAVEPVRLESPKTAAFTPPSTPSQTPPPPPAPPSEGGKKSVPFVVEELTDNV